MTQAILAKPLIISNIRIILTLSVLSLGRCYWYIDVPQGLCQHHNALSSKNQAFRRRRWPKTG